MFNNIIGVYCALFMRGVYGDNAGKFSGLDIRF